MFLQIRSLLPVYFDESKKNDSGIWGKDLQFGTGEHIQIIAPSGSGKTSLMHFLYGMRRDYTGSIVYGGKDIKSYSLTELALMRTELVSIVFQDLRLFPEQTVSENLEIKRQLRPFHGREKIAEMADMLGIGNKLNASSRTCSYGEQQRVAIIRALLQPFKFLLIDEPFSHLDTANAKKAMQLILEECVLRKATVVFADLEQVDYFPYTRIFHL